jgi:hypothetical protein
MSYFLAIKNNRVEISRYGVSTRIVKSVADYNEYIAGEAKRSGCKAEDVPVFASSSMDLPEEFTSNKDTIALAKALRA